MSSLPAQKATRKIAISSEMPQCKNEEEMVCVRNSALPPAHWQIAWIQPLLDWTPTQNADSAKHEPHMSAAYGHLREAKAELARAAPNKGGHRERALELVNQAIRQVED